MNCPICRTTQLVSVQLEDQLWAFTCNACHGHWISSAKYHAWLAYHGQILPEKPYDGPPLDTSDVEQTKICPECHRVMLRYLVGHGTGFSLDLCTGCQGVWFDPNQWQALKGRNLHDEVHLIITSPWQSKVRREEARNRIDALYEKWFQEDYEEIQRIRDWVQNHPNRQRLIAFLIDRDPYS